jgi:hypothetical protein
MGARHRDPSPADYLPHNEAASEGYAEMARQAADALEDLDEKGQREFDLRAEAAALGVPSHLVEGLVRYVVVGIKPGGFLYACLANDLLGAARRADPESLAGLGAVARFIIAHVPGRGVLSYENVDRYVTARAAERAATSAQGDQA